MEQAAVGQNGEKQKAASGDASIWLDLVDNGAYGTSWDKAGTVLQKAITREAWETSLSGVRESFGRVQQREELGATYTTELPGVADGEYVVIL
jgi:hypothetical protein